jgi:putative ABC transport system permease protein
MRMALKTRWIKILKDIWSYRSRSLLVILSIAVGVAAVGMINNAGKIIQRDLYGQFEAGNPAYLEIFVSPFQKELANSVAGMREVKITQARRVVGASILNNKNQWEDLTVNVLADYKDIQVNRFSLEQGSSEPGIREIVLERQSAKLLGVKLGDQVSVEMPDKRRFLLTVTGIVHDVYVMPMTLLGQATGYVSMDTLEWMGAKPYFNRLDIMTSSENTSKESVLEIGNLIRDRTIEPSGYIVSSIRIPGIGSNPGQHWAQNQIHGFILILQIMGVLAVILSAGLVINTVSAILTQQIKQIGIMRSLGADRSQMVVMYLANILVLSLLGLVLAIPMGLLGAWWLSEFAAKFLNFNVTQVNLPLSVLSLQLALGLFMPLGVAMVPILSGTRLSVYDAIYQYGLTNDSEHGGITHVLGKLRQLSPPIALSLRNTFRKKSRLAFTLVTLTLAGAMFIAAFSTRSSLTSQINDVGRYIIFDASIGLPGGANRFAAEREALRVPGVTLAEGWATAVGVIVRNDGSETQEFEIVGLPSDSATIDPLILQGSWLSAEKSQQVVINQDLLEEEPDLKVGDQILIKIGDKKRVFEIAGLASKHLSGGRIYMDYRDFERFTGRQNQVDTIRVLSAQGKPTIPAIQDSIAKSLDERFKNSNFTYTSSNTRHSFLGKFTEVFNIILIVLVIMAGLLAIVGGLGLTGSLGMNVLERTREIGVLRAVGANNFIVRQVVVVEGVVVGMISWFLGAALSAPSGWALASAVIYAVLKIQPHFRYSFGGLFIWLGLVLLIGVFSSLAPARKAAKLRVREVLDYE